MRAFTLPNERYSVAFFLGALYHLKNPYYALETLAKQASYCILSTRVARCSPSKDVDFSALPIAYLVDPSETNNDPSNYWIFSEAGLRRIVERAQWRILDFKTFGNRLDSDPASAEGDERAFCLLESRMPAFRAACNLVAGWHELEGGTWRWTERRFAVRIDAEEAVQLMLSIAIPELLLEALGPITVVARANRIPLAQETYSKTGHFKFPVAGRGPCLGSDVAA